MMDCFGLEEGGVVDVEVFTRALVCLCTFWPSGNVCMAQPAIAAAMGVSLSTVNRAHMGYEHGGLKALRPKANGGRKHENMSLAQEKVLLSRFAKAAGAGEMLNIHDLKAAYEKAIGHATSNSTVYNLLHRHGWRKLMPRPFHPKRDLAGQDAFKKTAFLML